MPLKEQLSYKSPLWDIFMKYLDAVLNMLGSYNTKALSNVNPEKD